MHYLITDRAETSHPEGISAKQEHGDFTIFYSRNTVDIREENGVFYLFHGYISNNEEVKELISAETDKDIDLLQKCYEKGELNALKHIDGLYTAIIVEKGELELFRDMFGSKPVYFTRKEDDFILSSNIGSMLQAKPGLREVNEEVAADYLSYGLVDHRRQTFFKGIERLKPRESLQYNKEEVVHIHKPDYLLDKLYGLKTSLKQNIQNLKPGNDYFCPVSGGLDSTITASQCKEANHIHISFEQGTRDDQYITEVEDEYELNIQKIDVKPVELLEEVDRTIGFQEEPTAFPAVQAQSLLYRNIGEDSTVISGVGADELFYGYPQFLPFYITEKIRDGKPLTALKELINYRSSLNSRGLYEIAKILFKGETTLRRDEGKFVKIDSEPPEIGDITEARNNHLELFYFPHILRGIEKNSQQHRINLKSAFLSKKLYNYSENIEYDENFKKGLNKYLLRLEFKEELPESIYSRKQKTGFVLPENKLYTPSTRGRLLKTFRSETFQERELVRSKHVLKALKKGHLPFETAYRFYSYENWMREFID